MEIILNSGESAIAAKKLWVRLALCMMFKPLLLRKYAAADLRIDGPQRGKPSAFKNAAVAKLARRGRLKICYIRNVVGSNPTCGTILFNMSHSSNQNKGKTALGMMQGMSQS